METILIIEDDPSILLGLEKNLKFEGYQIVCASDGEEGLDLAFRMKPDLIILDILLPKINGLEICKTVRQKLTVPIIMLTARDKEIDKIMGLDLGADDYITKPFSIYELIARIKAVLRRKHYFEPTLEKFSFGEFSVDFEGRTVHCAGELLDMSPKEFEVLKFLIRNEGKVVSREEILRHVWGYDYVGTVRTVDNFINKLRSKFEKDTELPEFIQTVRGVGYKFIAR